jgi:O-antigen ligase
VTALIAPPIGLATVAVTISLAEPDVFRPLGVFVVAILALVIGVGVRHIVARPRETPSALTVLGIGYAALIVISLPPLVSGLDAESTTGAIFEAMQLIGGLALLAVARTLFATLDWRPYLRLALAGAVVATILALVRMTFGVDDDLPLRGLFGHGEPTYRAVGPFTNSNYYGLLAAVASVMTFALATRRTGVSRLAWLASSAVLALGTVLSFSRGATLALAIGLVAVIWSRSRRAGVLALVVAATAGITVLPLLVDTRLSITTGGVYAQPTTELAQSDSFRTDAAAAGVRLFIENPFSGVGFGQFRFHAQRYVGGNPTSYPHSTWIKVAAEQGLVGIAVFGALVVTALAVMLTRRHPLLPVVLAGLIAYAIAGTFLEPLISLQTTGFLWITLGIVLATAPRLAEARSRPERRPARRRSTTSRMVGA